MMTTDNNILFYGWDIGGAHLKVACSDKHGQLQQILQFPCALWRGIAELNSAFHAALKQLPLTNNSIHAVTMTGELVDAFADRQQGVEQILATVATILPNTNTYIFADQGRWLSLQQAAIHWQQVASMNWLASAHYAATHVTSGLFIDIGSTTCDIIAFDQQQVCAQGRTDYQRQRHYELVYSGAIRTPLMSFANAAPLQGQSIPLAAEWFASSADIWLLLDELKAEHIQDDSADGQPWSKPHAQQRLARMLATDANAASDAMWRNVALWFAEKQLQQISDACLTVLSAHANLSDSPFIGAGVGHFIAKRCAQRLAKDYIDFSTLCAHNRHAADHAPAAALALLAQQQLA